MMNNEMEDIELTHSDEEYLANYENSAITKNVVPHKHARPYGWQWMKHSKKNQRRRKKKKQGIMKDKKTTDNHRIKAKQKKQEQDWKDWYQEENCKNEGCQDLNKEWYWKQRAILEHIFKNKKKIGNKVKNQEKGDYWSDWYWKQGATLKCILQKKNMNQEKEIKETDINKEFKNSYIGESKNEKDKNQTAYIKEIKNEKADKKAMVVMPQQSSGPKVVAPGPHMVKMKMQLAAAQSKSKAKPRPKPSSIFKWNKHCLKNKRALFPWIVTKRPLQKQMRQKPYHILKTIQGRC